MADTHDHLAPAERWDALLRDPALRQLLADAAADLLANGLTEELGSLRLSLLQVMTNETESDRLVSQVTRLVTATAQALRVQRTVLQHATESGEPMTAFLARLLGEVPAPETVPLATPSASHDPTED